MSAALDQRSARNTAQYRSTRDRGLVAGFGEALTHGLAPDGGLFVPCVWPQLPATRLDELAPHAGSLGTLGATLIAPFTAGDALEPELGAICREAFSFPAPLTPLSADARYGVLELFHGPTAAFKDFGARFLAACFERLHRGATRRLDILVATSGDTGGAVAAAFHRRPGLGVTVLFPKGLVSPAQERQLTCWGDNVLSLAVRGTFDDCQRLVKAAFVDPAIRARHDLSSANSINLGRLLPQMVYYAAASLSTWKATSGERLNVVIPSGNLGNAVACIWARHLGLPIGRIVLAHNANRTVPDFFRSGEWQPRASVATLASAMDVGNPSNMERLRDLVPDLAALRSSLGVCSVDDAAIRARIQADHRRFGRIWCPHTAVAAEAYERLAERERAAGPWAIVATAHPAKFPETVEPLIGARVPVPAALAELYGRPSHCIQIDSTLEALAAAIDSGARGGGSAS